jgi:hypothetical protein
VIRIFTDLTHCQDADGTGASSLAKPFCKGYDKVEKFDVEGGLQLTNDPSKADLFLLPMLWNFYYGHKKLTWAEEFIEQVKPYDKPILTQVGGDVGVTPLYQEEVYVLRQSGYHSSRTPFQLGMPVFFGDPLKKFDLPSKPLTKPDRPKVGFCGQANFKWTAKAKTLGKLFLRNQAYYLGLTYDEPQALLAPESLRFQILNKLKESEKVDTAFLISKGGYNQYLKAQDTHKKQKLAFYQNIWQNPYTMCVRGFGNFSVRFYETLALGRIPLFINTDCVLPWDQDLNWRNHVVWVEQSDIKKLPELLADFHHQIHPDDFKAMQLKNRELWENKLSSKGFFSTLLKKLVPDHQPSVSN